MEVGLWLSTEAGTYVIKKDGQGHPDVVSLAGAEPLPDREAKKIAVKRAYEQLTGRPYPHDHAATRQVLWDFLEVAIKYLP
jgi:hypothetical protein